MQEFIHPFRIFNCEAIDENSEYCPAMVLMSQSRDRLDRKPAVSRGNPSPPGGAPES